MSPAEQRAEGVRAFRGVFIGLAATYLLPVLAVAFLVALAVIR